MSVLKDEQSPMSLERFVQEYILRKAVELEWYDLHPENDIDIMHTVARDAINVWISAGGEVIGFENED